MLTFTEFLEERKVDPAELAHRVARRYGKKDYRSGYMKVKKGEHIPFTKVAHSSTIGSAVAKHEKLGDKVKDKKSTFAISDLHASQHHASTGDHEKLKTKIANKSPGHVHIITHKGKHIVADGHNAIMAAKLRGEKHITATHTDLDSY